ncbi:hypothetical protein CERSUDRAFT_148835 [Gelatoporia subvermispora B]|uniref:Vacuolar ATPase assembly integral membrane protein VMA21 n=1 Tax=Ceriporiopsis subvermispora (strain B) TaxID=914234 RepID=M2RP41_CERS8|nr:hypothetical protein CERSUDRAFT_148835 [Gelatoporia subvermispora B]
MSEQVVASKLTAQAAAQGNALIKLLVFSLALAIVPISSYFLSRDYVWGGNTTWAAFTAAGSAQLILVAFIVVSVLEDQRERSEVEATKAKKSH